MRVVAVIPARMAASRFPGKPLAPIAGRPMLEHVFRRTAACRMLDDVFVATCDRAIAAAASAFGARTIMTSPDHARATDRVAEACATDPADIVVIVQGDEPMVRPSMIEAGLKPLAAGTSDWCVNVAARIDSEAELRDPNTIKIAIGASGQALYFSREVIPAIGVFAGPGDWFKQVCVIPLRRELLRRFSALPRGPLEAAESVDMLRLLENGIPVRIVPTDVRTHAVDTPADLRLVEMLMADEGGPLSIS